MPRFSRSPLAFEDCRVIFERALKSQHGIQIRCKSFSEAFGLRTRLNTLRAIDRNENKKIYQPDDRLFGNSVYDGLMVRQPKKGTQDDHVIFVEPRATKKWDIQEISRPRAGPLPDVEDLIEELTGKKSE